MTKFFSKYNLASIILFFLIIGVSIPSTTILNSWAIHENEYVKTQKSNPIPDWIRNNAEWWADGKITEDDFLYGITFLVDNNIIKITNKSIFEKTDDAIDSTIPTQAKRVPDWIKNNAGWWAKGQISDSAFVSALEWLISKGIMKIDVHRISFIPIEDVIFADALRKHDKSDFVHLYSSLFEVYVRPDGYTLEETEDGEKRVWISPILGLHPEKMDLYNELSLWHDPQRAVVIYPIFTGTAYAEGGFYDYYNGRCDHCTTTTLKPAGLLYTSSGNAVQALSLLGYDLINDIDVDKNPDILKQYDKVVVLHNEYVTRAMFDAITSHPKVIYLYPNALYAEIEVDYQANTMTLIRGHNYPPEDPVSNGFDWEFDNTHPYEFDNECKTMELYSIEDWRSNVGVDVARMGANTHWMTNCYPEIMFYSSGYVATALLKAIKGL
ncbi:hypothetical protein AAA799O18_00571 [Marine Group I thaumarchaeote SCGC AAA799-O18]|jgi:hypothetical protein|nr:hypothetical protein AAA799O18_00571 [Marine Group I thaumarchaeote SCGC AAA799-O18]